MTNQSSLGDMKKTPLKIYIITFGVYILISFLSIIPMITHGSGTLVFYDGLKKISINIFYVLIGFNLFRLIYTSKSGLIDLIAKNSLKKLSNIWYILVALLVFKLVVEMLFKFYIIPNVTDANVADKLGYSSKMSIAPHADLMIAIFIVWVLLYVLNYALKLQQEQDLTI